MSSNNDDNNDDGEDNLEVSYDFDFNEEPHKFRNCLSYLEAVELNMLDYSHFDGNVVSHAKDRSFDHDDHLKLTSKVLELEARVLDSILRHATAHTFRETNIWICQWMDRQIQRVKLSSVFQDTGGLKKLFNVMEYYNFLWLFKRVDNTPSPFDYHLTSDYSEENFKQLLKYHVRKNYTDEIVFAYNIDFLTDEEIIFAINQGFISEFDALVRPLDSTTEWSLLSDRDLYEGAVPALPPPRPRPCRPRSRYTCYNVNRRS